MGPMREILFRGKQLSNGEWVYGDYCRHDRVKVCMATDDPKTKHMIVQDGFCDWGFEPPLQGYEVDPATVGQYTGLMANDKRIFEGDIVNGLFLFERPIAGVVTFRDGSFGVQWMRGRVEEFSAFTSCCNVAWEVIGNIEDNPELLEEGENDND